MLKFKRVPATEQAIARRKKVYDLGTNDVNYKMRYTSKGKSVQCPIYTKWSSMMQRCYSRAYLAKHPAYAHCEVTPEWLTFSNFAKWYESNSVEGYHMDKDFKIPGNHIYGPDTCLFIPQELNKLLTGSPQKKTLPMGVSLNKVYNRYGASISFKKKSVFLGLHDTVEEAQQAYAKAKNDHIKSRMVKYPEFAQYLQNHLLPMV